MTDNDIIKALECCVLADNCKKCPYDNKCVDDNYVSIIAKDALDLINRQKAEIERLQGYNGNLQTANTALSTEILDIKSEAIKEFAERLKKEALRDSGFEVLPLGMIDNLVKKMGGEQECQ